MNEDLEHRLGKLDDLISELFRILNDLLAWKNQTTGGLKVVIWGLGIIQAVVMLCLAAAANSLNKTAEILGNHAVELATAKTKIDGFIAAGPRFTAEMNSMSEEKLKAEILAELRK